MSEKDNWQDAVATVIGAKPGSTADKRRAFQHLHDTGIGYRLPGRIADQLRSMVEAGVVTTKETRDGEA